MLICLVLTSIHGVKAQSLVPDYRVTHIVMSGDGTRLAVLGRTELNSDGQLIFFIDILDAATLEIVSRIDMDINQPSLLDISPDGRWLVYGLAFGGITILDTLTGELEGIIPGGVVEAAQLDWNPIDGRLVYSLGNTANIVDTSDEFQEIPIYLHDPQSPGLVGSVAWSSDGRDLATTTRVIDHSNPENNILNIQIWREDQIMTEGRINEPSIRFSGGGGILWWSPNSQWIANNYQNDGITLFDVDTGEQTFLSTGGGQNIAAIAWSPDSSQVAASGAGMIWIWDISSQQIVNTITVDGGVGAMIWSPTLELIHSGRDGLYQNGELVTVPIVVTPAATPTN